MHLLAAQQGAILDADVPVDLEQSAAEIAVLTTADSEIACLARARQAAGGFEGLRLANLLALKHPYAVDLYVERTLQSAKLIVVRLLGGRGYWPYGIDRLVEIARKTGAKLALLQGEEKIDTDLAAFSTVDAQACARLSEYFVQGGPANYANLLAFLGDLADGTNNAALPVAIPRAGLHAHKHTRPGAPVAAIVFYRAHYQAGDIAPIDTLIEKLAARGLDARAIHVASLKDKAATAFLAAEFAAHKPAVAINLTGFAVGDGDPLAALDVPVLQAVLAAETRESWVLSTRGLGPRDVAMNVALPELDGRIFSRAIGFKGPLGRDAATQVELVGFAADEGRCAFVADLTAAWAKLGRTQPADRRIGLILANYPGKDGRLANGVGLDTPASTVAILHALKDAGYAVADAPDDSAALMAKLIAGPTNAKKTAQGGVRLPLARYRDFFGALPQAVQDAVIARWGAIEQDRRVDGKDFVLPIHEFGNVAVAIQPARGYEIDPKASYHDPALVPPHGYLAFHAWMRDRHALVFVGKHGNLEWLPGKGLSLSENCFPEAAIGPVPAIYPFIVNDPGEGTQAKRRISAVVIDHLTPPLTRAGAYGAQAALERLIDEYDEARRLDPRRMKPIAAEILDLATRSGVADECGITPDAALDDALAKLDAGLCDLKDLQIRDGLHVFGKTPDGKQRDDTLAAIASGSKAEPEKLAADFDISGSREMAALLAALDARRIAPGPSGAPTRGRADVLPTGRNFYSVDTRAVPTPSAWALGWKSAGMLLDRHVQEHGDWPRAVALSAWGTANMRTGGDDIAQGLALMGAKPVWDPTSLRVTGFEIMSLDLLDRPRVDVTLRVSGFFRDAFATLIDLFDSAVRAVAALDEPAHLNPLAARAREEGDATRVFGSQPGAYGAGLQSFLEEGGWTARDDLADAYRRWSGFAYRAGAEGVDAQEAFAKRLARIEAVLHNQDNREHDLLDSSEYHQFEGGLAAAVAQARGAAPTIYHNDHSRPESPKIGTLGEEIARIVRARAANPKWIDGCKRHGYKGAFEMAATVDYLFAFAATTDAVKDRHFDALFDAYLRDEATREFIADANAPALREMAERFIEARTRGLWRPGANDTPAILESLIA
jgi:cobaltochelatase CobN